MVLGIISCPHCGVVHRCAAATLVPDSGWPEQHVRCDCGHQFDATKTRDDDILSGNVFKVMSAASSQWAAGKVALSCGKAHDIHFRRSFDVYGAVFFTPYGTPVLVKDYWQTKNHMTVVSSVPANVDVPAEVEVSYSVYGLHDLQAIPDWWQLFYSGLTNARKEFWKPAFLDYAVSLEVFVAELLRRVLTSKFNAVAAEYFLKQTWQVERRMSDVLRLATGCTLKDSPRLWQAWKEDVKKPRNHLSHGRATTVERSHVERAHQVVYECARWIARAGSDT